MTEQDKRILLQDLCARLPYHPILHYIDSVQPQDDEYLYGFRENADKFLINDAFYIEEVVPYLRPMSSMTDEEREEENKLWDVITKTRNDLHYLYTDFLLSHHLDYRGLIPIGLALEASEGMYSIK